MSKLPFGLCAGALFMAGAAVHDVASANLCELREVVRASGGQFDAVDATAELDARCKEVHPYSIGAYSVNWLTNTNIIDIACNGTSFAQQAWYEADVTCPTVCDSGYELRSNGCYFPEDDDPNLGPVMCGSPVSPLVGNPVNTATGNKYQKQDLMRIDGAGLSISYFYNSKGPAGPGRAIAAADTRWTMSYSQSIDSNVAEQLAKTGVSVGGLKARLFRPDGTSEYFVNSFMADTKSTGTVDWQPLRKNQTTALHSVLEPSSGAIVGFKVLLAKGGIEIYDVNGRMLEWRPPTGQRVLLEYTNDQVSAIKNIFGQRIDVMYDSQGVVARLVASGGQEVRLAHNAGGNLTELLFVDNTPGDWTDNPRLLFLYDDARFPHLLTGIVNENGIETASWAYDDLGRGVLSSGFGGKNVHSIRYRPDGTSVVVYPTGAVSSLTYSSNAGLFTVAASLGEPCVGCGQRFRSAFYDNRGHLSSIVDLNGNVTNLDSDGVGMITRSVMAAGSSVQKIVDTQWHPLLKRPEVITYEGRIIEYSYTPDGKLSSMTVRVP